MRDIARLFSYTKGLRKYMAFIAVTSLLAALLAMVVPFIIKLATDNVTAVAYGSKPLDTTALLVLLAILAASYGGGVLLKGVSGYIGDMLATRMRRQLSQAYYDHLLTLPQTYYDNENTGKIISRLDRAIADVTRFINMFSNTLLQMLLTIIIAIAVMAWYSWEIALLVLLQIPIYIYLTARTSEKWQVWETEKNDHIDIARGRFTEVVGNMRLVKSFGTEQREAGFFATHFAHTVRITAAQSRYWHMMDMLRSCVQMVIYVAVYGLLFWRAAHGLVSIGDVVLLITLLQQTSQPLQNMSFFVDMYQRAITNSRDYAKAMSEKPEVTSGDGKQVITDTKATVVFRDVCFAYSDGKPVLRRISFTIHPGKKLALVGESGGGKTTIANLLMQLYHPSEGTISINGTSLARLTTSSLRQMIATVFQDAALFSGTIRENIAYARPDASSDQIEAAAKAANAYGFIRQLPQGLDTEIGERGIKLSGGQRQRIAIARAILKDAPILILDEATSALDSRAEHEVQTALDRLMKGRTTLIIAHRLSTIANVDTVVTLQNGQVDEVGTPAELAKTGGIYAQLLELQLGTSKAAKKKLEQFDISS